MTRPTSMIYDLSNALEGCGVSALVFVRRILRATIKPKAYNSHGLAEGTDDPELSTISACQ